MSTITHIELTASFAALRVNRQGDSKAILDIPASELAEAIKLVAMKERAVRITIDLVEP